MPHRHIAIPDGSRVSPLAKLTAQDALPMNRRWRRSASGPTAKAKEKDVHRQSPKRSLNRILASVLLTVIIAGLTCVSLSLIHSTSTRMGPASPTASPVYVGTEHPVASDATSLQTPSAERKSPNPVTAPAPQAVVVEKNSRREVEPSPKAARENVEQAREEAERAREHIEDLYQERLISTEAYKKGQAEYQHEMAKYQDQMAKYRSATPRTRATDEE
jgi:hypothetical protein